MRHLIAALMLLPLPAMAQTLPNLFSVTDVAADDVLNIRTMPDASASILSELPPNATGIEVIALDPTGKWAQVNTHEFAGWVATRYLAPEQSAWVHGELPKTLRCVGTEPFWSLRADGPQMILSEPGNPDPTERRLNLRRVMDRGFEGERLRALIAGDGIGRLTAVIQPAACSDGMSDRSFGLNATVILDGQSAPSRMLTGCCSVAPYNAR